MNLQLRAHAGTHHPGKGPSYHYPAGVLAQAPAARPLQRVACRICDATVRVVVSVPEPSRVCRHGLCPLCIAWLRGVAA